MTTTFSQQQFLTVWDGELTLNFQQVASVRWYDDEADVQMANGKEYKMEGEDFSALKQALTID
ncbi:hypothetical protein H6F86_21040 [Phormidium sp. FACHB-592]|uniref:Uncharacterized protein n=1 Tax=Stenomitos frigidus AS-A4 TaxID=2933935 RepID=A0ABV0KEU1_9CYAN|nr:hypothetical protein [Phormidium sp. FACHB-592]MBD2076321.1 hypothetical protein [Phormidium sp. FACHB-592]